MKYTSNYNLKKPDGTDTVLIDDLNGNMDLIDVALSNFNDFTKDGFNNFLVGVEPQGGVKRIWYDDPAIEYAGACWEDKRKNLFFSGSAFRLEIGASASFNFTGTGVYLVSSTGGINDTINIYLNENLEKNNYILNSSSIIDNYKDNLCLSKLYELLSGLPFGTYSIKIENVGSTPMTIEGFDVLQTNDLTTLISVGKSYINSERVEILPANLSFNPSSKGRCDLVVTDKQGNISVVEGADGVSEKAFRVEEDGKISREYIENIPDWSKNGINIWSSVVTGVTDTGWIQLNNVELSNHYRLGTALTDATFYIGFIGTGLDIITLESIDQGIFAVSIDGGTEVTYDNYNSTLTYQVKKNIANELPFGYHEVRLRNTGAKNTSAIDYGLNIDAFDIYLPATPDLPADTQPLAGVYPMSQAATMASIPARPTSAEEKGWIRHENEFGCRYVGSGWRRYPFINKSAGKTMMTEKTDDYVEYSFLGNGIRIISEPNINRCIAEISIDEQVETILDLYNALRLEKAVVYENTNLSYGYHTIRIRNTGTKNADSAGYWLQVDAFEVYRPLYLQDVRNLSPIKGNDAYHLKYSSRTGKALPNNIGEMLDRLEVMGNVIKIENEHGLAYLYPDGRAECFLEKAAARDFSIEIASGKGWYKTPKEILYFPIVFTSINTLVANLRRANDDIYKGFTMLEKYFNNFVIFTSIISSPSPTIGTSVHIIAKGRWY